MMVNVFELDDYREIFTEIFNQNKKHSLAKIAKACNIQPSYLTNVLKGRAHFSLDQAFDILSFFSCDKEGIDFVLDLIEYERSASPARKKLLKEKITKVRNQKIRSENYIETDTRKESGRNDLQYYLDPITPILHMYFGTKNASNKLDQIAVIFGVSTRRIETLTAYLLNEGFIKKEKGRYIQMSKQLHLPKDSPLLKMHHIAIRTLSLERMLRLDHEDYYSFSATLNSDDETKLKIQSEFLKFVKKCQSQAKTSRSENVMQMHFDLFPWTK